MGKHFYPLIKIKVFITYEYHFVSEGEPKLKKFSVLFSDNKLVVSSSSLWVTTLIRNRIKGRS